MVHDGAGYSLPCCSPPGVNCEVNIDDCASNPCTFGVCRDGINHYDCVCQPGFTGREALPWKDEGEVPVSSVPPIFASVCPRTSTTLCPEVMSFLIGTGLSPFWFMIFWSKDEAVQIQGCVRVVSGVMPR
jgi:hypothetical protein